MRAKTIREQKLTIRTEGYCAKRMRYYLRKARWCEWLMSRKKASLNHEALILDSIRYRNKANWYRVRFMIGRKDALEDYMVVELDLTRGKFDAIAANFYDSTDMALARRYASRFIEAIFNVTIPDEWK